MTLKQLIKKGKYQWVNDSITAENFPQEEVRGEVEIFDPGKSFTFKEGIQFLKDKGYEPANAYELLTYGATHLEENSDKPYIIALGTVWLHPRRFPHVICVYRSPSDRKLRLFWTGNGFVGNCVLAGVRPRKPLVPKTLSPSNPLTLESRISELEKFKESVEKILKI